MAKVDLSKCWPVQQRYVLSLMGFLAIVNAYTMRSCLAIALTEMTSNKTQHGDTTFNWSAELQGQIKGAFFIGYMITHIPGAWLCERYGGKHVLSLGILSTAIFSILTPITAETFDSWGLIILRVLMGLGEGTTFPALSSLLSAWIPEKQRARLGSFVFGGGQIGSILGTFVSGIVLKNIGWPSVFYLWGGIACVWYIFFIFFCYSTPEDHPFITESEREYLREKIHDLKRGEELAPTPWIAILTSVPMMALVSAQIGHDWGFYIMANDLPKYFKDILETDVISNGFYSALPFLVMWIFSILSGIACDYMINNNYITVTNARKAFTGLGAVIPGILLLGASYAGTNEALIVFLFSLGMGFMGLWYPGMKVNPLDLSPNYAATVMAISNAIGSAAGFAAPIIVSQLTQNKTSVEWQIVFWITFVIFIVTTISYTIWASAEIQPWNDPVAQDKTNKRSKGGKEAGVAELGGADKD